MLCNCKLFIKCRHISAFNECIINTECYKNTKRDFVCIRWLNNLYTYQMESNTTLREFYQILLSVFYELQTIFDFGQHDIF